MTIKPVLRSQLTKKAKSIQTEKACKWHEALDVSARDYGFSNFRHYQNVVSELQREKESLAALIYKTKLCTEKEELIEKYLLSYQVPFKEKLIMLRELPHSPDRFNLLDGKDPIQKIANKIGFMHQEISKFLLEDFQSQEGLDELQFMAEHFTPKELSINALEYELFDDYLEVEGNYKLSLEFEYEVVEEEFKNNPRFKDRKFIGSFVVSVDLNKNITVLHSSISEDMESGFWGTTIR